MSEDGGTSQIPGQADAEAVVGPIALVEFGNLREMRLVINAEPRGQRLDVEMLLRSEERRRPAAVLRVVCRGVVDFHAAGLSSEMHISGLAIEPIEDRQMEGIRYQIWDYEEGDIRFFARDVVITSAKVL